MSLIISTRLNSPVTIVVFADQLAQLTPTSRQAKLAVIARALGLDLSEDSDSESEGEEEEESED